MRDYSNYYPTYEEVILKNGEGIFEQQLAGFEGVAVEIDEVEGRALVQYHQNPLNEFRQDRRISVSSAVNLSRGSYVKVVEDDRLFLTLSEVNQNQLVKYALIRETNTALNFIGDDNKLIKREAITSAQTLYTTGIKDEKVIRIPDGMQGVQLPYDEDTQKLNRGDCFVFNKSKYEITFYDETTYPGLLVLICKETPLGANDDKINQIADRWVNVAGGGRVDRLPWLDEQESPIEEPEIPIEPEIPTDPIEPEPSETISYIITAQTQYVGEPDNEIYWGSWCDYTVIKLINDAEVACNFTFELSNDKATLENIDSNSCRVNVGSISGVHKVDLLVTDVDKGEIVVEKEIKLIGR